MSYQHGTLGQAEVIGIIFNISMVRVFLSNPVQVIALSGELAWLVTLVAGFISMAASFVFLYVYKRVPGDLYQITEKLLGIWGARIMALLCISLFFTNAVLLFRQFTENTLLTALPNTDFQVISFGYALCVLIVLYAGIEAMGRSLYIIIPFGVIGLAAVFLLLYPYYDVYNLAPWLGYGIKEVISASIASSGYNISGFLAVTMLAPSLQNYRTVRTSLVFGLGGSALIKSASLGVFVLVFGVQVGLEKVLPFYEMARLVYISRYLQRIESLFILLWVIAGTFAVAVALYFTLFMLARLLNLPAIKPIMPIAVIILEQVASLHEDIIKVIRMDGYLHNTVFAGCEIAIPFILLLALWIKGSKQGGVKKCPSGS